jgi:hypothetical protein
MIRTRAVKAHRYYVAMVDDTTMAACGFSKSNSMFHPVLIPAIDLKPEGKVRVIAVMQNAPLMLAAENRFKAKVEYCSPMLLQAVQGNVLSDLMKNPNGDLSFSLTCQVINEVAQYLPSWDFRNFRTLGEVDKFQFGVLHHIVRDRIPAHKSAAEKVEKFLAKDFQTGYTDYNQLVEHHPIGGLFKSERYTTAVDVCGAILDPRMYLDHRGKFRYKMLCSLLGMDSFEQGAQIGRMFIDQYGGDKVPYDHEEILRVYHRKANIQKSEQSQHISVSQILGLRVFYQILTTPRDDIHFDLQQSKDAGQGAQDVSKVQQYLCWFINEWLSKLLPRWKPDGYHPSLFGDS